MTLAHTLRCHAVPSVRAWARVAGGPVALPLLLGHPLVKLALKLAARHEVLEEAGSAGALVNVTAVKVRAALIEVNCEDNHMASDGMWRGKRAV